MGEDTGFICFCHAATLLSRTSEHRTGKKVKVSRILNLRSPTLCDPFDSSASSNEQSLLSSRSSESASSASSTKRPRREAGRQGSGERRKELIVSAVKEALATSSSRVQEDIIEHISDDGSIKLSLFHLFSSPDVSDEYRFLASLLFAFFEVFSYLSSQFPWVLMMLSNFVVVLQENSDVVPAHLIDDKHRGRGRNLVTHGASEATKTSSLQWASLHLSGISRRVMSLLSEVFPGCPSLTWLDEKVKPFQSTELLSISKARVERIVALTRSGVGEEEPYDPGEPVTYVLTLDDVKIGAHLIQLVENVPHGGKRENIVVGTRASLALKPAEETANMTAMDRNNLRHLVIKGTTYTEEEFKALIPSGTAARTVDELLKVKDAANGLGELALMALPAFFTPLLLAPLLLTLISLS